MTNNLSVIANHARISIQLALEPKPHLWVELFFFRRRRLLLGARLLLAKLLWLARGGQLKVARLPALHSSQLARVEHQNLARLLLPPHKREALRVVRRPMEVAAKEERAFALAIPELGSKVPTPNIIANMIT